MQRVDLIQDLRFETATSRIKATPDGEYLIASGEYWAVLFNPQNLLAAVFNILRQSEGS